MADVYVSDATNVWFICDRDDSGNADCFRVDANSQNNWVFKVRESPADPIVTLTGGIEKSGVITVCRAGSSGDIARFQSGTPPVSKGHINVGGLGVFDEGGIRLTPNTSDPDSRLNSTEGHVLLNYESTTSSYRFFVCTGHDHWLYEYFV